MTPDENDILASYGDHLLFDFSTTIVDLLFYGPYLILVYVSSRVLWSRRNISPASRYILALSALLFVGTTLRMYTSMKYLIVHIQDYIMRTELELEDRYAQSSLENPSLAVFGSWTRWLCWTLGDGVLIWRACMMPNQRKLVSVGLCELMAVRTVFGFHDPFLITFFREWVEEHATDVVASLAIASNVLSIVVNLVATATIGLCAWKHHRSVKGILHAQRNSQVMTIMIVLVESGLLFSIFQILNTIFNWATPLTDTWYMIGSVFDEITSCIAAVTPILVIIIVSDDKSPLSQSQAWVPPSPNQSLAMPPDWANASRSSYDSKEPKTAGEKV